MSDNLKKDEAALEAIEEAKQAVINAIAETMDLYGVTPSAGRLYGTMYIEGEMTLDQMKDRLGMSKPSMSTAVKKLQGNAMVQKTWQKGSRRELFKAEKNFFKSFVAFYCKKWEREVEMNLEAIDEAANGLAGVINNDQISRGIRDYAENLHGQIVESKRYYNWLNRLIDLIESGEIFDCLPIEEDDK
ncbi:DNA-binding transcriptional regulator GbsR (MarR family) [Scopulibacillus darangshiensis]|uniref:HTH-type transcriptional regulator n=1 Tax=Scopulibacillus darangshiensis TaxID=442528 RepID=A0A4R2P8U8_9BACL|nr:GbsR/MarR family transcriptional regulator [Scopulibacillus darangshiensis]TCP31297.1 DNA-binding transcriptional regulator GbsR (MarR family) [Scopulibacillus darangshiensis]